MSEEAIVETGGAEVAPEVTEVAEVEQPETTETEATETAETEEPEVAEEFAMVWPEGYEASEQFAQITTEAAMAAGITDGRLAGEYTAKVIAAIQDAAEAQVAADDAALKEDWGADYRANMDECKAFMGRMCAKAGLSEADVEVLSTPKGLRLVQAIRTEVGEGAAAVGKPAAGEADEVWAREVMSNPAHPDYKAFRNPSDGRWRELNARYNRIKGF